MVLHCSNSSVYKFESRQSHKARFSTLRSRSFVLVFKLFAVLFKSCSALCMNSKAWQSTQGRLSAGITVPASALASVRKPVVAVTAATSRRSRVREGAANMAARGRERGSGANAPHRPRQRVYVWGEMSPSLQLLLNYSQRQTI